MNINEPSTPNNLSKRKKMVQFAVYSNLNDSKVSDKKNQFLDGSVYKRRKNSSLTKKKERASFHKKAHKTVIEKNNSVAKRLSLEMNQTKSKPFFHRYSSDRKTNPKNNNRGFNKTLIIPKQHNTSFIQLEKDIKNALNLLKNEIESQKNNSLNLRIMAKEKENNRTTSVQDVNNLKTVEKINGHLTLCLSNEKKNLIKRKNSFEVTTQATKKLIKRMKTELNEKKIINNDLLKRVSSLLDSYDDSENEAKKKKEKNISFSPNSNFIFIFDILLIIANLYSFIFIPLSIAKNEEIIKEEKLIMKIIKCLNDIIYLFDFLLGFVRGYYNYEMKIIRSNKTIISHYLKQDFFMDLIEGIPIYIIVLIFKNYFIKTSFQTNYYRLLFVKQLLFIKSLKIIKVLGNKKNKALEDFYRFISVYFYLEKIFKFFISFFIFILFIHLFICMHIFFAIQNYPNWISYTNNQNERFFKKYITSFYFLVTTMTTVGYGDIVCISFYERIFHIILLGIGTILYSFIVSKIGNYLRDQSYEQMKLSKDLNILESIRLSYPAMPFKLYSKINRHLLNISKKRKKTGISVLINGIPDTIKNELLFKIYSKVINGFIIFKGIENSNFILQILTNFIPITSKKEETLILEGELIDNVIFIKDGKLSLEASIDLNDPYNSINKYLKYNFIGISKKENELNNNNIMRANNSFLAMRDKNYQDLKMEIDNFILDNQKTINNNNSLNDNNGISMDLGRLNFSRNSIEESGIHEGYQLIKIIDIRKNEHFGDIHIFLQKPSPFTIKVKSRKADILLLRKHDIISISKAFPNIWRRIYNKSYHNLVSIKQLTFKILKRYYNTYFYNKENNFPDISNLDVTALSKMSKKSSKSDISRVIRRIKTNVRNNNSVCSIKAVNNKNSCNFKNNNPINSQSLKNPNDNNDDITYNEISFSDSLKSIEYTTSINNKEQKKELKKLESNNSKKSDKKLNENYFNNKNIALTKLTFKQASSLKNTMKENSIIHNKLTNNPTLVSKDTNIIDTNIKKKNCGDNSTEIISNNNNDKNEILILDDIDKDFARKIKKKINKRNKLEKIRSLFELQKIKYKNDLIELYTQFVNQNKNIDNNKINISNNLYDFIHNKIILNQTSNNKELSELIENEEDTLNSTTKKYSQFDLEYLKKVSNESFEIKSSYININNLTEGKMIKNKNYKKLLELKIQNCLNNFDFDEKNNDILTFKNNNNKIEKNKDDNFQSSGNIDSQSKNEFSSEYRTLLISKSKKINSSVNSSNNNIYSFSKVKSLKSIENVNEHIKEKQTKKEKSKFQDRDFDKNKIKFSSINSKDKQGLDAIKELEKEENFEDKKENNNKLNENKEKILYLNKNQKFIPSKIDNKNENNNNIILTSSINAINEVENENISKNQIKILNLKIKDKELMTQNNFPSNNVEDKKSGNCLIF